MLKNYFRIAFRNLGRSKFSSGINIGGLAIGMAVAILIGLWIYDELSYDKGMRNHDRIAAVLQNQNLSGDIQTWWGQAKQLAPALRKDYGSQFKYVATSTGAYPQLLSYGENKLKSSGAYMEPDGLRMLAPDMLSGSYSALQDPSSIVLSASLAKNIFGNAEPMGKILKLDTQLIKVTGVYTDLPVNSSFATYQFIVPFQLQENRPEIKALAWGNSWFQTYVQLNDNVSIAAASGAIKMVKAKNSEGDRRFKPELFLHPLDQWHLRSKFKSGVIVGGSIEYVWLYATIGLFVLLLACINFMNLSTARSEKRAKEVGIRKAVGSLRGPLIRQFFSESVFIAGLAFVLAIVIVQLLLPFFNQVSGKKMGIPWNQPMFWLAGICFTIVTGLIAGSYPALYLSSFRPVKVLKGTFRVGRMAALPRKVLVVVQFTVSVTLIIGTIAVFRQIQYVKDRPVGYSRAGLLMVPIQSDNVKKHFDVIRGQLMQTNLIEDVATSQSDPTNTWTTNMGYSWRGKDPAMQEQFTVNGVSATFGRVTGWQIKEGRDFSADLATDSNAFVINETAAKYMGFEHPVGEVVKWGDNGQYTIIGVVKDMVMQSPYEPARQMIFNLDKRRRRTMDIRVKPQAVMSQALGAIAAVLKQYNPENPFEYRFADQEYAKKFGDEERIGRLAGFFTVLAIVISLLGLLGLSAFVAEQRIREIGIRKVLGASVLNLWHMLSREFIGLVGLSLLIGGPVAYRLMHRWLGNYQYHASLSWWIFASAALGALALTLVTVSFQAIKAALSNPVKMLRTE